MIEPSPKPRLCDRMWQINQVWRVCSTDCKAVSDKRDIFRLVLPNSGFEHFLALLKVALMKDLDRVRGYDKFPDQQSIEKVEAYPPPSDEVGTLRHQPASPKESGFRISARVVGLILRALWPFVTKFFPWLGWASLLVYAIIEFLLTR